MDVGGGQATQSTLDSGHERRWALRSRRVSAWRRQSRSFAVASVLAATISAIALTFVSVHQYDEVIVGSPRAAYRAGASDEDQIRDVLQAISNSYNRTDVKSAEDQLCRRAQLQWNPSLERVWLTYRLRHGPFEFALASIRVSGVVAEVTGRQRYANDAAPTDFTAAMERQRNGWKMCSST